MQKYEPLSFLLWNSEEDDYSVALFQELMSTRWNPDEIFLSLEKDKSEWLKVDIKKREDLLTFLIVSKSIEQLIGTKLLPILIDVVGQEFVTRRAMLSAMTARINYEHTKSISMFIKELNPKALIDKSMQQSLKSDHLQYIISLLDTLFGAVSAWSNLSKTELKEVDGKEVFEEFNVAVWKACSLAALMLEVSQTAATVIVFNELDDKDMDHVQSMIQLTLRDRSIMSSYLALVAKSKKDLISNERSEELESWLTASSKHIFTHLWNSFEYESAETGLIKDLISDYGYYNVNKALSKLGIEPVFDVIAMPDLVQRHLRVDKNIIHINNPKNSIWRRWKA